MKKITKIALVAASVLLLTTQAQAGYTLKKKIGDIDTKFVIFGFSQLEAGMGDGYLKDSDADVKFGADRIRLGWKYFSGPVRGKVFLDFNQATDDKEEVGLRRVIKDAFITYMEDKAFAIKVGLIKTPLGMGFTIPGWNLDVIKRGFDKKLAFERGTGIMLSGRDLGYGNNAKVNGLEMGHERPWKGFGYDIMIANQTSRSGAVDVEYADKSAKKKNSGQDNAYIGRLMYDWTELIHAEAAYGVVKQAGGKGTDDYKAFNFGLDSHFDKSNLKLEYYNVQNIRGKTGWDMSTLALTGTHYVTDSIELAIKDIRGFEDNKGVKSDVSNTYIGINYYIKQANKKINRSNKRKRNQHRMQLNYILAAGDTDTFKGVGGLFKDDAIIAQYQFKF